MMMMMIMLMLYILQTAAVRQESGAYNGRARLFNVSCTLPVNNASATRCPPWWRPVMICFQACSPVWLWEHSARPCEGQGSAKRRPSPLSTTRWLLIYQADVSVPGWAECWELRRLHSSGLPCCPIGRHDQMLSICPSSFVTPSVY